MAGDGAGTGASSEEFQRWIDEKAAELDASRGEVLSRALRAFRAVETAESVADADGADGSLDDRVAALEDDLDEKIDDVRERVIQIKRETDAKAPTDHGHPDLREHAERAAETAEDLRERLADLDARVDDGFEDFEEVLDHLLETSDELQRRATTLARAAVDLRDRTERLEAERNARRAADDLRTTANRNGDATADCEDCSGTVRLGLLSRPACPHCDATFADLDPSTGLFGSATLRTGPPPTPDDEPAPADTPERLVAVDGEADGGNEDGDPDE